MSEWNETLSAMFKCNVVAIPCNQHDMMYVADGSVEFTFEQMMQLPAILGTERLDFRTELHTETGYSELTPECSDSRLVIIARGVR